MLRLTAHRLAAALVSNPGRARACASTRFLSSTSDSDFGEIGGGAGKATPEADAASEGFKLDPANPPKLDFEHYEKLKGIDFKSRDKAKREGTDAAKEEWQATLDSLREQTEERFQMSAEDLERIKKAELEEKKYPIVPDGVELPEGLTPENSEALLEGRTADDVLDDDLKPHFGAEAEVAAAEDFHRMKMPVSDVYDPAAFPVILEPGNMIPKKQKGVCIFCLPDPSRHGVKTIKYTNVQLLHKFINERGMITGRRYNFNCAKHQRKLAMAIKQARFVGLLSFTDNFYAPESLDLDKLEQEGSAWSGFGDLFNPAAPSRPKLAPRSPKRKEAEAKEES